MPLVWCKPNELNTVSAMFGGHTAHRKFMRLRLELHRKINAPITNTFITVGTTKLGTVIEK